MDVLDDKLHEYNDLIDKNQALIQQQSVQKAEAAEERRREEESRRQKKKEEEDDNNDEEFRKPYDAGRCMRTTLGF
jgi:hypothetical protein